MFDYDITVRADEHYNREPDYDPALVCPGCDGQGFYGNSLSHEGFDCVLCSQRGWITQSAWLDYCCSFPPNVRDHMLAHQPRRFTEGDHPCNLE